ncbi:hypothetical protein HanIR_Chr14g0702081 [Helianthus annuus]|nr:hypothetical protein HanIR_Chr14g0702081 [Helianthus annuus]
MNGSVVLWHACKMELKEETNELHTITNGPCSLITVLGCQVGWKGKKTWTMFLKSLLVEEICLVCHKLCLDSFGEHAVHCRELPGFKYRHDLVRDVLFDIFRRAGISTKKETPVNFLTDSLGGRFTLRPADILVFGWIGEKHAGVDLRGVSPLVGLGGSVFTVGSGCFKSCFRQSDQTRESVP